MTTPYKKEEVLTLLPLSLYLRKYKADLIP